MNPTETVSTPLSTALSQIRNWSIRRIRGLCDKSFFWFVRIVGGPSSGRDICPELFIPLCNFAQDKSIPRKFIAMPRDWLKSTVFTKWFVIWLYLQNQELRQLIVSENERIAANFLHWIEKTLLNNKKLRTLYPDKLGQINNTWVQKNRWSGTACDLPRKEIYSEPSIVAIGVGGASQSYHFDYIHPDDLVGQAAMESPVILGGVCQWFDNIEELMVEPDVTKPNPSGLLGVGTHWGPGDFFCEIQLKYLNKYQWKIVPCQKDPDYIDTFPDGTPGMAWTQNEKSDRAESNWPEYKNTEYYRKKQAEDEILYWSQHMNDPHRASGLTKIDGAWFRFFHFEDRNGIKFVVCDDPVTDENKRIIHPEFRLSSIRLFAIIDPGGFAETKMIKRGSNNAIVIAGQAPDSIKKFVVWAWAGKEKDPDKFMDIIFNAHKEWNPVLWRIETFGGQDYIMRHIMLERKKRGSTLKIAPLPKDVTKDIKDNEIQALIPPIANGEYIFHKPTQGMLLSELKNYPGGLTNDLADCLGKLNKYCGFTRTKKKESTNRNTIDFRNILEGKNEWTGY